MVIISSFEEPRKLVALVAADGWGCETGFGILVFIEVHCDITAAGLASLHSLLCEGELLVVACCWWCLGMMSLGGMDCISSAPPRMPATLTLAQWGSVLTGGLNWAKRRAQNAEPVG